MFALKVWVQNEVLTGKKDTGLQSYVLVYCSDRWSGKTDVARITQALTLKSVDGVGIAQVVELLTEKPGTILTVRVPGAARDFFSQSQLPVQTVLRCPYSPRVQSHASQSVSTLKIPNTGNHTIVWTHGNTAHTGRNGQHCSCGCCASKRERERERERVCVCVCVYVCVPGKATEFRGMHKTLLTTTTKNKTFEATS